MKKKFLSLFLALTMLLSLCPAVYAADETDHTATRERTELLTGAESPVQSPAAEPEYTTLDDGTIVYPNEILTYIPEEYAGVYTAEELESVWKDADFLDYAATQAETVAVDTLTVAEAMRKVLVNRGSTFSFSLTTDISDNDVFYEIFDKAVAHTGDPDEGDYLLRGGTAWSVSFSRSYKNGLYTVSGTFSLSYYTTRAQEDAVDAKVKSILDSLNVYNASDYQKVKAVYDWLCANVEYDYDHVDNPDYKEQFTCYAAVCKGIAVCQGYSLAFYRMILELDVDARIVRGFSFNQNHAWNIVKLGRYYYNVDPTWDAGATTYSYFLKCQSTFTDHERREEYDTSTFHTQFPMDTMDYTKRQAAGGSTATGVCTYHHEYVTQASSATCTAPALEAGISCSVCGTVIVEQVVLSPALGHNTVSTPATEPTCTEPGKSAGTSCTRCGMVLGVATTLPATGHTPGEAKEENRVEPTESTAGSYDLVVRCSTCGEVLSTESYVIPCTGSGNGTSMAEAVRIEMNQTKTVNWDANTDEYDHFVLFQVPERGIVTFHATKPQASNGQYGQMWFDIYDVDGNVINGNDTYNAVNNSNDYYEFRCGLDTGYYYVNILAGFGVASGIFYSDYTLSFEADPYCEIESNETLELATALAMGRKHTGHYGGDNNYYEQFDYFSFEATTGHIYMLTVENADALLASNAVFMATGAADDDILGWLEPNEDGSYFCKFVADATGTVYLYLDQYYDEQFEYDITVVDWTLINDAKHIHTYESTYSVENVVEPTCGANGSYDQVTYCSVCGLAASRTTVTVPATGDHAYVAGAVVDPTCTEQGYTSYICQVCGDGYNDNYTASLGHTWGAGQPNGNPGETVFTCIRCPETKVVTEPVITRIAGPGRCETAIEAADELKAELGIDKFDTIILASGNNFADALAGSYLAAVKSAPILLHRDSALVLNLTYILTNLKQGGTVYILGGTGAVSAEIETMLNTYNIKVVRLAGPDRFATNLEILKEAGVKSGQEILVATGYNFADSLSASATGKPILLVNSKSNKLTEAQMQFLSSLGMNSKLTILGGGGAVSDDLASWLSNFGPVDRLAGDTRFDTSVLIARTYFKNVDTAFIAYGRNFPDGLSGGPVAYAKGAPLILTAPGSETLASYYVAEKNIFLGYVMGGTGAVSDETVNEIFGID